MNSVNFLADDWTAALAEGWEDRSMITLVDAASAQNGFASNIVITKERTDLSVEEYARAQTDLMRRELGGAELQILDERAVDIGGVKSYQRLQRFDAGEQIIQQVQTFFAGEKTIYVVTGTATLEAFDGAIPAFKRFVETFRLS